LAGISIPQATVHAAGPAAHREIAAGHDRFPPIDRAHVECRLRVLDPFHIPFDQVAIEGRVIVERHPIVRPPGQRHSNVSINSLE
jgi:hypothetical protein